MGQPNSMGRVTDRSDIERSAITSWLIVLGGLFLGWALWAGLTRTGYDFRVYFRTAGRILADGRVYQLTDDGFPFKYSPPTLLFLWPLGLFNFRTAYAGWNVLNGLGLFLFWGCAFKAFMPHTPRKLVLVAGLGIGILQIELLQKLFYLGQIEGILLGLVGAAYHWRKNVWLSASCLALAAIFKPPFLLLVCWQIAANGMGRLWRLMGCMGICGMVCLLASGPHGFMDKLTRWHDLLSLTTGPMLCSPGNQSLRGVLCLFEGLGAKQSLGIWGLGLVGFLWSGYALARWIDADRRVAAGSGQSFFFGWLLYGTALFSPLGWRIALLGVFWLFMSVVSMLWSLKEKRLVVSTFVIYFITGIVQLIISHDILGVDTYREVLSMRFHGLLFGGVVAIFVGFVWHALRKTPPERNVRSRGGSWMLMAGAVADSDA